MITIARASSDFEREPLRVPFGFKGRNLGELWQTAAGLVDEGGRLGIGVGTQSPLWCDPALFARDAASPSNALMFQLTAYAVRLSEGRSFSHPRDLITALLPEVLAHGRLIAGRPDLRVTFALNALVPVDHAAWQLYAARQGQIALRPLLTPSESAALPCAHERVGNVPVVSYGMSPADAVALVNGGHAVLKIKIGNDPDRNGSQDSMLAWDCARMTALHAALVRLEVPGTADGRVAYYLDANGRYDSLDRIRRFLDHCQRLGAADRVVLLEEPFQEGDPTPVRELAVRVAADESAHSVADVRERIAAGYGAIALKPAAKTMSVSLQMAEAAHAAGVPCFCADLTANPILVDWAKNLASMLPAVPGISGAVMESNGSQFYRNWETMKSYHPEPDAPWLEPRAGAFDLGLRFHSTSGGIFRASPHYRALLSA